MSSGSGKSLVAVALIAAIVVLWLVVIPAVLPGNDYNVIVLMVDTLRADHLGYHGYERAVSPNLDRFAARAAAFKNHYSQASRTGPSVASFLTGLHVRSHGVVNPLDRWDGKGILDESITTLAEVLRDAGYDCRAIVTNPNVQTRFGFGQGIGNFITLPVHADAEEVNTRAAQWIDEIGEKPFFLYLHYMDPHSPYAAPASMNRLHVDPAYRGPITGEHAQLDAILRGEMDVDAADRRRIVDLYDQEITYWDREFGRFLRYLESRGRLENTIIVVVADHGEEFFEHGGLLHGYTLYGEQLHVPLAVMAPGVAPCEVEAVTRNIDVMPTVLELVELPVPDGVQGQSLVPAMRGGETDDGVVFAEAQIRAVRTVKSLSFRARGWKYIETMVPDTVGPELYDLAADPGELENLLESRPDMAGKIRRMRDEFLDGVPEGKIKSVTIDEHTLELLKRMGYIGG
jgi:arylsulfatase A-like enzyme